MLSHILGNNKAVLGLNELHFVGRRWVMSSDDTWSRDRAVREAAELIATARRSIWDNKPTDKEMAEAESLCVPGETQLYEPSAIYQKVLAYLARSEGREHVVDQTPRNIVHASTLLDYFPDARVVHLVRDPRAVSWSQRNRWRQRWIGAPHTPLRNAARVFFNYHPYTVSKLWLAAYEQGISLREHPRYTRIRFEDIVSQPENAIRDLCRFLGIAFDPDMLDVANVGSSHTRHDESKRGISAANVRAWQGRLPVADTWICERMTGAAMRELGYEHQVNRAPVLGLLLSLIRFPFHALGVLILNPMIALRMFKFTFRDR